VPRIAGRMHKERYRPAYVLCSTAMRAQDTAALLMPILGIADAAIRYDRALYLAEWPLLLAEIRGVPRGASPLLVIGHNPGLEQLAMALARKPESPAEAARAERLAGKFPTAALAVLDFRAEDWAEIETASGELFDYIRPKDLDAGGGDA
jgi:phosphohistidine phosphatase